MTGHPLGPLAPLAEHPQFVVVLLVPKPDGRTDKIPHHSSTLAAIDAHDPANWATYEAAAATAAAAGPAFRVGFVLTAAAGFWCVDIDHCATPAGWSPIAQRLRASLPGTVAEVSQSGQGLHLWGRGPIPEHGKKNTALGLECYSDLRFMCLGSNAVGTLAPSCPAIADVVARYFPPKATAAGEVPDDGPCAEWSGPEDDAQLLAIAMRSTSPRGAFGGKASFADLYAADADTLARAYPDRTGQRAYDASNADAALAQRLAFYTGKDHARIDRMMRGSALARDKWDNRPDYLPRTISNACSMQRDVYNGGRRNALVVPGTVVAPAGSMQGLTFMAAAQGAIPATIENVHGALQSPESGVRIALDRFQDRTMISGTEGVWRLFTDADYGRLRVEFGKRGFKPVSSELMSTAVLLAADENRFDSAIDWANSLQWDGTHRIESALASYYRTADTPYTRAVGLYLFTAMAGRVLVPGCQADMVVVLVGLQGERKTSAVRALCPDPAFFAEINLKRIDDDDLARHLRGKLIGEIAELQGLAGRDQESVKAWVSRREEKWTPKYREFETTYLRRLVFVGTTNQREFLDDATGERRWLPVTVGRVDVEAIERDRDQLWAEGIARFKAHGVAWQEAERLAGAEHAQFKITDPWHDAIDAWLSSANPLTRRPFGDAPFQMDDVCLGALHRSQGAMTRPDLLRVGKVLRALGFDKTDSRGADRRVHKVWARVPLPSLPVG